MNAVLPLLLLSVVGADETVSIGSKKFTENVILGDQLALLAREAGVAAEHRRELGGTIVVWEALKAGSIDAYVEYTGTIREAILHRLDLNDLDALREELARDGVAISDPLGFNNTYALGMLRTRAEELGITRISDLRDHPELKLGFSNEFMKRSDGWPRLRQAYQLPQEEPRGMDHDLAYQALRNGNIDAMELYTTDAEILQYDLEALEDDLEVFPRYEAVILYRQDLAERAPEVVEQFQRLVAAGITAEEMTEMNLEAETGEKTELQAAADFLRNRLDLQVQVHNATRGEELLRDTWDHLFLVSVSLTAAIVIGLTLGCLAAWVPSVGHVVLGAVGVVQAIPSLALLAVFVPLLGIGELPAIVALFIYSLLPIVVNTHAGLTSISPSIDESARALGLYGINRVRWVDMPMASQSILAGIRTSAVINVGTATLGGLIGAGGYGELILRGIRLNDYYDIWYGAAAAALLSLAVYGGLRLVEEAVVPRGLRLARQA